MFTGIAEGTGKLISIDTTQDGYDAIIENKNSFKDLNINDSICCSGICLTIVELNDYNFKVQLVQETLDKTNAKTWRKGTLLNLERALLPNTRLGGHYVQGHVDTTSKIISIENFDQSARYTFSLEEYYLKYVIEKGYICVDGLSLSVAKKNKTSIEIALIPHTMKITNFHQKNIADEVNIEVDMFAKYIENYMDLKKWNLTQLNQQLMKFRMVNL